MKEFKVNDYITLKLEDAKTVIYVAGERFRKCLYLLLNIPIERIREFDGIESIDEAVELLNDSEHTHKSPYISHQTEFWGHCSNIQAWAENKYDTRLLHSNLAFPLLKKLTKVGDPIAKKVFKEEIAKRLMSNYPSVIEYLISEKYTEYLDINEIKTIFNESNKDIKILINKTINDPEKRHRIAYPLLIEYVKAGDKNAEELIRKEIYKLLNELKTFGKEIDYKCNITEDFLKKQEQQLRQQLYQYYDCDFSLDYLYNLITDIPCFQSLELEIDNSVDINLRETIKTQLEYIIRLWDKIKKKQNLEQRQPVKLTSEPRDLMRIFRRNKKQIRLQAILIGCEMALHVWSEYISEREIRYHDTVVGCRHRLEPHLPQDALNTLSQKLSGKKVDNIYSESITERYLEPICALHEDDIEFPSHIEFAYYSIYNLFRLVFENRFEIKEELIIGQFLGAIAEDSSIEAFIKAFSYWWQKIEKLLVTREVTYFGKYTYKI